jgi:NAD(P)-dependent dehydrogenase (short-subunit alcohol dehydrogenase family)
MAANSRPVTIVTGASKGIGAAVAVQLGRAGHDVVVGYRTDATGAANIVRAVAASGGAALSVRVDVTAEDEVAALFAAAAEQLGTVTGLVNNAGLTGHLGDLADTPVEVIRRVIDVNFLGVVLCARHAAQVMSTRSGGHGGSIVNISSGAATLGSPHEYVHYAGAKAAVDALTVGLAKELAPVGVRVNAVAPGVIRTGIHSGAGDAGRADRVADRVPMGRAGEPGEVAPAIVWLLGPDAGYVTGTVLRVAGGM